jgi:hypothetical protein
MGLTTSDATNKAGHRAGRSPSGSTRQSSGGSGVALTIRVVGQFETM